MGGACASLPVLEAAPAQSTELGQKAAPTGYQNAADARVAEARFA